MACAALENKLILEPVTDEVKIVCGVDAAFDDKKVYAVACSFSFSDFLVQGIKPLPTLLQGALIEESEEVMDIDYPYVPGFFALREGRAVVLAIKKLKKKPNVILVDGHGIAHPRRFGLASYVGLELKIPTIGCAKSRLVGEYNEPGIKRGAWTPLKLSHYGIIGAVVRTHSGVKPVFVSPGNLIDLDGSIKIVLATSCGYRIPEPLRVANIRSKRLKNKSKFQMRNLNA